MRRGSAAAADKPTRRREEQKNRLVVGRDGDRAREGEEEVVGMRDRDVRAAAEAIALV